MRSNEPQINRTSIEMYHCDNPIFVTAHVENKSVISYAIHIVEGLLYSLKVLPIAYQHNMIPFQQNFFRFWTFIVETNSLVFVITTISQNYLKLLKTKNNYQKRKLNIITSYLTAIQVCLLPNTEVSKNIPQQLIVGDFARDLSKMIQCLPNVYGQQIS